MKGAFRLGVLFLGSFCLAGCTEAGTADPEDGKPYVEAEVGTSVYYDLVMGGSLYVGTVRSVDGGHLGRAPGNIGSVIVEHGVMRFAVEKTVWGQQRDELRVPYIFTREDLSAEEPLATDWGGGYIWDRKHPAKGQRLMLLMRADKDGKPVPEDHYNEEWPVNTIWRLRADDPLVPGFEEAARYLSEKDPERRREVFRNLCRSRLKNIRRFASYAAFGDIDPDWSRDPHGPHEPHGVVNMATKPGLVLDFLRYAGPALDDEERQNVTRGFGDWLGQKIYAEQASEELRGAFEDWYLTELACAAVSKRRAAAVRGLAGIAFKGDDDRFGGLGPSDTVRLLFRKGGRGPLIKRLEDCPLSTDDGGTVNGKTVGQENLELLELLRQP